MSAVEIELLEDAQRVSDALTRQSQEEHHKEQRDREAAFVCSAIRRVHDFYIDGDFVRQVLLVLASKANGDKAKADLVEEIDSLIDWIGEEE